MVDWASKTFGSVLRHTQNGFFTAISYYISPDQHEIGFDTPWKSLKIPTASLLITPKLNLHPATTPCPASPCTHFGSSPGAFSQDFWNELELPDAETISLRETGKAVTGFTQTCSRTGIGKSTTARGNNMGSPEKGHG